MVRRSEFDFKIYDESRHMPLANHLYVFEVVGAPELMRSIVGSTHNEAVSALHDEIALMRRSCEE